MVPLLAGSCWSMLPETGPRYSRISIQPVNCHAHFDTTAKACRQRRRIGIQTNRMGPRWNSTPSASAHQKASESHCEHRLPALCSLPNESGNIYGKGNLWMEEFQLPSFHLCCNKAVCGWQPCKILPGCNVVEELLRRSRPSLLPASRSPGWEQAAP